MRKAPRVHGVQPVLRDRLGRMVTEVQVEKRDRQAKPDKMVSEVSLVLPVSQARMVKRVLMEKTEPLAHQVKVDQ